MDDEKGVVIDPYCGSGTTLVSAKLMGHKFIGIEIANEYVDSANNRLLNIENERKLVNKELDKHVVSQTFSQRKDNGGFTGKHRVIKSNQSENVKLRLFK